MKENINKALKQDDFGFDEKHLHEADSGTDELEPLDFHDEVSVLSKVLYDFWDIGTHMDELANALHMEAQGYFSRAEVDERLRQMAVRVERIMDKWERHMDMVMA